MDKILTYENKTIEICDCDYQGHFRLNHLFNRFAQIATTDAKKRGLWNDDMNGHYGWVVSKQTLKLYSPICVNDYIQLSTFIDNGTHVSFPRYYRIEKDGQIIGECSSLWTLIDIEKRRIVAPKRIGIDVPKVHYAHDIEPPQTIETHLDMKYICQRQVLYSDVDINQHMNNTRYIEWAFDILDYHLHEKSYVQEISIHYKKEIPPLTFVDLYLANNHQRYIIEGRHDEIIYFTMEIIFHS